MLLRSDGIAVAIGSNDHGQCNIPPLDEGMTYIKISAGLGHTVLIGSDGGAVAVGDNAEGQCNIPPLDERMAYTYTQLSSGLIIHCFSGVMAMLLPSEKQSWTMQHSVAKAWNLHELATLAMWRVAET